MAKEPEMENHEGRESLPLADLEVRGRPSTPPRATQREVASTPPAAAHQFAVRLMPQHPGGVYRRAGMQFSTQSDVLMDVVPDVILSDPWLMVAEVTPGVPPVYDATSRRAKQGEQRR